MLFIGGSLVALALLGGCSRKPDNPYARLVLDSQANALQAQILVTELRDGRLTNAVELLEEQIDSSIIIIDSNLSRVGGQQAEAGVGTLRLLKAYRQTHPRRREAVIGDTNNEEMMRKAARVLSELK